MYLIALFLLCLTFLYREPFDIKNPSDVKKSVEKYKDDPFEREIFSTCCCPSTYSSSQGCLCESKRITALLASRGGNRMSDPL
jgi:hypothetical protein